MKINFYHEIVETLKENSKSITDIVWIGTKEATIDIDRFFMEADAKEYNNGYGGAVIAQDLIIAGSDWWLSRDEYDGSEWWVFNIYPQKPKMQKPTFGITGDTLFGGSK